MSESPSTKDLPKIDNSLKGELLKEHNLKATEVNEKVVLPSADDVKQEKNHQGIMEGVEKFSPENLKSVKTREPASGAEGNLVITI